MKAWCISIVLYCAIQGALGHIRGSRRHGMMERARSDLTFEAIAARPTFNVSVRDGRNLFLKVEHDDFWMADTASGPWVDVEVSMTQIENLPATTRKPPQLRFRFQTRDKHDINQVQHVTLDVGGKQIVSSVANLNAITALLQVRSAAPHTAGEVDSIPAVQRRTLVDVLKTFKWRMRLNHFTETAQRNPSPELAELKHKALQKVTRGMVLARWVSALDPVQVMVDARGTQMPRSTSSLRKGVRDVQRGQHVAAQLGLMPPSEILKQIQPDPADYDEDKLLAAEDFGLVIRRSKVLLDAIRDPDSRGIRLATVLECYPALKKQLLGPPSKAQMAAIKWRRAFEAHRDAKVVCRAAREGWPMELSKRARLGVLAGALEEKCVSGPGQVASPYWTAVHGHHAECVKILFDEHDRLDVPIGPQPPWMGVAAPGAPGLGAATGGAAAAGGQQPPTMVPGAQAAGPAAAGGQGTAAAPAPSSQDSSAEGGSSAPGGES